MFELPLEPPEYDEPFFICPCCHARLTENSEVYTDENGVIGCEECYSVETKAAQDLLEPIFGDVYG